MASKIVLNSIVKGPIASDATFLVEIQNLDGRGLEIIIDLELCDIHGFFLQP